MVDRTRIVCSCGGELTRPIPRTCPYCGRTIARVRRSFLSQLLGLAAIAAMFAILAGFVWWLAGQ